MIYLLESPFLSFKSKSSCLKELLWLFLNSPKEEKDLLSKLKIEVLIVSMSFAYSVFSRVYFIKSLKEGFKCKINMKLNRDATTPPTGSGRL